MPSNTKYVTYKNRDRDAINTAIFHEQLIYNHNHYNNNNDVIMIFCDKIEYKKNETFIPLNSKQFFYENCGESDINTNRQGRIDPVHKIYIGCNIMLTENIDVISGIPNGTQATIEKVILKEGHDYTNVLIDNNISIRMVYASDVNYIKCKHSNSNIIQSIFTIKPKMNNFKVKISLPQHLENMHNIAQTYTMRAMQIPIIINNATTGHKLQGSRVEKLFVHSWHYRKNWPYVVLSRVKQFSGLYLRKKLDSNLNKYKLPKDLTTMSNYFKNQAPEESEYNTLM
jgi:hypothetical protein